MLPTQAFLLAGFILAHALWSVSDLPQGKGLVPLAGIEIGKERQLVRFDGKDQGEALAVAGPAIEKAKQTADSYAFAREGAVTNAEGKQQVILVDVWTKGLGKPISVVQRYSGLDGKQPFRVIGDPIIVADGKPLDTPEAKELIASLREGLSQHPEVSKRLAEWKK